MSAFTLATTTAIWALCIAVLKLLDLRLNGALASFLHAHRITLKLFFVRFHTSRVPSSLHRLSRIARRPLRRFYTAGAFVVALLTPFVCVALLLNVGATLSAYRSGGAHEHVLLVNKVTAIDNSSTTRAVHPLPRRSRARHALLNLTPRVIASSNKSTVARQTLVPHLPPLTLRHTDLSLLFLALLCSVLAHELGHLLCALVYDVPVLCVGVFVAFLFPGAFVKLSNLKLQSSQRQLHIVCAGIWHNLIMLLCSVLLVTLIPILSLPLYTRQGGALVVTELPRNSPLRESLTVGDLVTAVADAPMSHGLFSYESVLSQIHGTSEAPGFCISKRLLRQKDASCCRGSQWRTFQPSHTKRCFTTAARAACLDAMNAASQPMCHSHEDCVAGTRCAKPKLFGDDRLIVLSVTRKKLGVVRVLFDGSVAQLWRAMSVSEYVPRGWRWMGGWSVRLVARLDVPVVIARLLWFVAAVCALLAASNMAPALFLDGQLFVSVVVSMMAKRFRWKTGVSERVETTIVYGATMVVVTNVLLSLHFMTK